MRVFHFVGAKFGLDDLRKRHLKIATLHELNDPFELFSIDLADPGLRRAVEARKDWLSKQSGLLCFSRDWHNPVQWTHYAEKHTGLCLGFDVPDNRVGTVEYARRRLVLEVERFQSASDFDSDIARQFLFTKYSHWRYENEIRWYVPLRREERKGSLYFKSFADDLRLAQVIVGARSTISRARVRSALGNHEVSVEVFKARLAFKTFRVVRQQRPELWK